MESTCAYCKKVFTPSKNDARIKYCSADCRILDRNKNKYTTDWVNKNRDSVIKYRKERYLQRNEDRRKLYAENKDHREKQKDLARKWAEQNPEKKKAQRLREHFGITIDDYNLLMEKQGGACAICGTRESGNSKSKYLFVDHCHETGVIRGLLCSKCNFAIGQLNDDVGLLFKAIEYLRGDGCGKVVDMVQSEYRARRSGKST